ncbi:hypothetical protein TNCV_1173561 [Trichonephila clavipes]|uniref:Uncharacterized protein n=1 Tax=Trichonephila clavipes TaxID=2585209 RepID=A0A8X6VD00_TRICX|nr:hypothetical protein TNCV_1173561 [Trichonephila clavipes]
MFLKYKNCNNDHWLALLPVTDSLNILSSNVQLGKALGGGQGTGERESTPLQGVWRQVPAPLLPTIGCLPSLLSACKSFQQLSMTEE